MFNRLHMSRESYFGKILSGYYQGMWRIVGDTWFKVGDDQVFADLSKFSEDFKARGSTDGKVQFGVMFDELVHGEDIEQTLA